LHEGQVSNVVALVPDLPYTPFTRSSTNLSKEEYLLATISGLHALAKALTKDTTVI